MKENPIRSVPGIPVLLAILVVVLGCLWLAVHGVQAHSAAQVVIALAVGLVALFCLIGLYMVEPNQAAFYGKRKVSQRVRNFESGKLKVNELEGSPIEIAAVIVWQVIDSAEAVYNVDDYESFVHIQSESALRTMATSYPYDQHEEGQVALRSHAAEISKHLRDELAERLADAGVQVIDARISHLAYAPEIAQAMLQRQQANAIISARTRIVAGAVGMVEMALNDLQKNGVVQLDEERKAQMVSNLLVVLCGDRSTQPIVNAGTLY